MAVSLRVNSFLIGSIRTFAGELLVFLLGHVPPELNRVPGLAHLVLELTAVGLTGLFQAMALSVELPAVIAAADPVLLDLAVIERGAAVAAAGVQQADPTVAVTEQDQILAECADFAGNVSGVGRQTDRVPVTPQ
jgi:hypothetical protein